MVHFELLRDRNILIVTPEGPLEKEDFEKHAKVVGPFLESNGKLAGLMICRSHSPVGKVLGHLYLTSTSSPITIGGPNAYARCVFVRNSPRPEDAAAW